MTAERKRMLRRPCHYCGGTATSRDHIVPVSRLGMDALWNLVPACEPCQLSKGDGLPTCRCTGCTAAYDRWAAGERRTSIPRAYRTQARRVRRRNATGTL